MAVRIAAWNIEGRLSPVAKSGRGCPAHIAAEIIFLDADVVFLADAYQVAAIAEADRLLEDAGYEWWDAEYNDTDTLDDRRPFSRFLARIPVKDRTVTRFGDVRTLQTLTVTDGATGRDVTMYGIHLDDRSNHLRARQVDDLMDEISEQSHEVVLLGDFNAAVRHRLLAVPFLKTITSWVPHPLVRSLGERLSDMVDGQTIERLHGGRLLHEADDRQRPTMTIKTIGLLWLPSVPVVQLDHMFGSARVQFRDFLISKDGGSDHRAISATIAVQSAD